MLIEFVVIFIPQCSKEAPADMQSSSDMNAEMPVLQDPRTQLGYEAQDLDKLIYLDSVSYSLLINC